MFSLPFLPPSAYLLILGGAYLLFCILSERYRRQETNATYVVDFFVFNKSPFDAVLGWGFATWPCISVVMLTLAFGRGTNPSEWITMFLIGVLVFICVPLVLMGNKKQSSNNFIEQWAQQNGYSYDYSHFTQMSENGTGFTLQLEGSDSLILVWYLNNKPFSQNVWFFKQGDATVMNRWRTGIDGVLWQSEHWESALPQKRLNQMHQRDMRLAAMA